MIEQIGTAAPMEVALLGAFTFILGAFALILWDLLRERMRGWLRVMARWSWGHRHAPWPLR